MESTKSEQSQQSSDVWKLMAVINKNNMPQNFPVVNRCLVHPLRNKSSYERIIDVKQIFYKMLQNKQWRIKKGLQVCKK